MEDEQTEINEDLDDLSVNDSFDYNMDDPFNDYGSSNNINKHADLLKELTNFDPVIQRRMRNWLGLEWNDKEKTYKKQKAAIMNEEGVWWAIGFLQTYQSKTNIITNLSEHEFKYIHIDIIDVAWLDFPTKDNFGVQDPSDWHKLCTELEHSALLVLAGAGDGKYTKFLGESVHRTESINMSDRGQRVQQGYAMPMQSQDNKGNWINSVKNKILGRT